MGEALVGNDAVDQLSKFKVHWMWRLWWCAIVVSKGAGRQTE
jgi:hypothetical protein